MIRSSTQTFANIKFAKLVAQRLAMDNWLPCLRLLEHVPKRIIVLALHKIERTGNTSSDRRSKAEAFLARLHYYAKLHGIKLPKQCWKE